ncbi:S8 family peptidase [Halosimplex salinum]|uniref:S8 family peptidase n=1 Tax=Halosimplex salinum TaxID=1710538 RepID=UPI000F4A772C|nr:S8 family peptidase [Halosimplex salinum]
MPQETPTRREVLQAAGAGLATVAATGQAAGDAPDDDYIVGTSNERGSDAARRRAQSVKREFDFGDLGKAVAGKFPEEAREALQNNPNVRYVEPDGTYEKIAQTLPWGIDRVDADLVHAEGETGGDGTDGDGGADLAILDTGIDSDHPDLQANLGSGKAFVDCGSVSNCRYGGSTNDNACNEPWDDDDNHGTHCAGIADADDNSEGVVGVSTDATLHAVKVLDGCGSGSLSDVAAGVEYVADQGWDVASLSLGASSGDQTLQDACQYAENNGVLLVAASGNDGPCTDCVGYPAAYDSVVAVGSTDSDDSLSSFSSTGPELELAAPGGDIYSTVAGGYDTYSGTSMACPHVSGAGAQLMDNGYTNSEARQRLRDSAEDVGLAANESGSGLLDVEAALGDSSGGDTSVAVSTGSASNVGDTTATLSGSLDDLGGASSSDCYFEYRESGASSWTATSAQTLSATGSYSEDVSGLSGGTDYEFRAVADASDGDTDTGTTTSFTTSGGTSSSAPVIDSYSVTEAGSPNPHAEITADWAVSDADGDLDSVVVEVVDSGGSVVDSSTTNVSGSSASGSDTFKIKQGGGATYDVVLTVTDAAGNSTSETQSVSA